MGFLGKKGLRGEEGSSGAKQGRAVKKKGVHHFVGLSGKERTFRLPCLMGEKTESHLTSDKEQRRSSKTKSTENATHE